MELIMIKISKFEDGPRLRATVIFDENIADYESYASGGMKAKVIGFQYNMYNDPADPKDIVHKITFDFLPFENYNRSCERTRQRQARISPGTAREADKYHPQEWYYFSNDLPFNVVDE
jgi:hypothetical protein